MVKVTDAVTLAAAVDAGLGWLCRGNGRFPYTGTTGNLTAT